MCASLSNAHVRGLFATLAFKMALDCKGNRRGRCLLCSECQVFTPWAKNIRCAYCDCPPTKHENVSINDTATRDDVHPPTFADETDSQHHNSEHKLSDFENSNEQQHFEGTLENDSTDGLPAFSRDALHGVIASHDNSANKIEPITGNVKRESDVREISAKHKILTCPICRKKFKKVVNLKNHILLHKGRQNFKRGIDELIKHKNSHYREINSGGPETCSSPKERKKQSTQDSKMMKSKRRRTAPKMTSIAPKQQTTIPPYQPGINIWGSSNQGAFVMNPLATGLFSPVNVPQAQLMQANTVNQIGRGVQAVYQQTPQQTFNQADNNMNQKLFNMLQMVDAKINALSQIDRKLDFIIHSLGIPRQQPIETQSISLESNPVAHSFEQIAAQIDDANTRLLTTPEVLPEKLNLKRGSLSPGEPIPENVLDEIYRVSVSRRNLAKNLVFFVFTPEELQGRNCSGKVYGKGLPKEKLNQQKLHTVKMATFKKYPCDPNEMDLIWQRECIKAIDKAIRSRALSNKL